MQISEVNEMVTALRVTCIPLCMEAANEMQRLINENAALKVALEEKTKEYEAMYQKMCWMQQ